MLRVSMWRVALAYASVYGCVITARGGFKLISLCVCYMSRSFNFRRVAMMFAIDMLFPCMQGSAPWTFRKPFLPMSS